MSAGVKGMSAVTVQKNGADKSSRKDDFRRTFERASRVSKRIFSSLGQPQVVVTGGLTVLLIMSSLGVISSAQQNRALFDELTQLQEQRDDYQRQWSQLLLEQSALGAHGRIEQFAASHSDMVVPSREQIVLVDGGYNASLAASHNVYPVQP